MTSERVEAKWVPFGCIQCGMGPDPARALVVDDVVVKIEGNPKFDKEWPSPSKVCAMCYGAAQKVYNPHRIKAPMKRTNPKKGLNEDPRFVEISWDEAYDILVGKLKEARAKGLADQQGMPRVAAVSGVPIAQNFQGHGWFPFWRVFGHVEVDMGGGAGTKCTQALHTLGELWYRGFIDAPDYRLANYVIVFGRNESVHAKGAGTGGPKVWADAKARGARLVHVCPAMNQTAGHADEWVPIKVKTDTAFVLGMLHVILHESDWRKACDVDFLKNMTNSPYLIGSRGFYVRDPESGKPLVWDPSAHGPRTVFEAGDFALDGTYEVKGIEKGPDGEVYPVEKATPAFQLLIEHVKQYTPEWASQITDVPAETIRRIAREFAEHAMVGATINIEGKTLPYRPVATALGRGTQNGWGGYHLMWARTVLQTLFGALEVPGAVLGTDSRMYVFVPFEKDADGLLLSAIHPMSKGKWHWPPKERAGVETLTPISGPGPMTFGIHHLAWKSFTEPLQNWPSSMPDVYIIYRCNPVVSQHDSNAVRKALEKIPFIAAFAFTMNETNWYADLLLPDSPDLESLQLSVQTPTGYKAHINDYSGYFLRQPVVRPRYDTRDMTDVMTELAARLEILPAYNGAINQMNRLVGTPFQLEPKRKYSVEEIVEKLCRNVTKGQHGLDWFKENGGILWPVSELGNYLHVRMVEKGIRYELPYQGRIKVAGEELVRRVKETGLTWWERQAQVYTEGLPEWQDFPGIFKEVFQVTPEHDMWLICHRTNVILGCQNIDVPWSIEAAKDVLDVPGVLINPRTAARKGIRDGDRVCMESISGKTYADAVLSETVRPDVLSVLGVGHYLTPESKDLGLANPGEVQRLDERLISPDGSQSDQTLVRIYRVES